MGVLAVGAQHALEARFAGDIYAFVGQRRDDACRRLVGKATGSTPESRILLGQCVGGWARGSGRRSPTAFSNGHAHADPATSGQGAVGTGAKRSDALTRVWRSSRADHFLILLEDSLAFFSLLRIASSAFHAMFRSVLLGHLSS